MIYESLYILKNNLDTYLRATTNSVESQVILGNIAFSDQSPTDEHQDIQGKVVISLISIQEDVTLKNQTNFIRKGDNFEKKNTPVFANLNILITANYPNNYQNALKQLNKVVEFFQGQRVFSYQNSPIPELANANNIKKLEVKLEMMSLNFEQLNHLWGALGGKIIPSVLYKARIIEIERDATLGTGMAITHITINEN